MMTYPQRILNWLGETTHNLLPVALLLIVASVTVVEAASSLDIGKSKCEIDQQRALAAGPYELVPDRVAYAAERICRRLTSLQKNNIRPAQVF